MARLPKAEVFPYLLPLGVATPQAYTLIEHGDNKLKQECLRPARRSSNFRLLSKSSRQCEPSQVWEPSFRIGFVFATPTSAPSFQPSNTAMASLTCSRSCRSSANIFTMFIC
jgi:hypothetical protein